MATLVCALVGVAGPARADRVVLTGGTTLEGKVTRRGGRVIVEVGSGTIAVPASSVARVEKSESPLDRFEARYRRLSAGDVTARLSLADYCRDHGLRGQERRLLREVIDLDPDNAPARARLGYVKTDAGWLTHDEAMRQKGLVLHEGRWVTAEERAANERRREEATRATVRQAEEDAIAAVRRRLILEQAELDAERIRARARRSSATSGYYPMYAVYASSLYGAAYQALGGCVPGRPCPAPTRRVRPPPRPPPTDTTRLSVVKVPYRSSR